MKFCKHCNHAENEHHKIKEDIYVCMPTVKFTSYGNIIADRVYGWCLCTHFEPKEDTLTLEVFNEGIKAIEEHDKNAIKRSVTCEHECYKLRQKKGGTGNATKNNIRNK